jgi:hypothetical protein
MMDKIDKIIGIILLVGILLVIAFWGTVGTIAWHFISKYW